MKKPFFILFLFACLLGGIPSMAQDLKLDIKNRDRNDTVFYQTYYMIGVTEPGATVTVNGQGVKVYKTGTFVFSQDLLPGINTFDVRAVKAGAVATASRTITRSQYPPLGRPILIEPPVDTSGVVATLEGAYLNYGWGTDRLGGAKINYLPSGIPLQVVRALGDLYGVQLSGQRMAYIPKEYVAPLPEASELPVVLSESWSVRRQEKSDLIAVRLEAPRAFTIRFQSDPACLILDLHGVICNTNWLTQSLDTEAVDRVDLEQVASDVLRVYAYLKSPILWGYTCRYEGNVLLVEIKHRPNLRLKGMTVGLDAGHGGPASSGAISPSGLVEKDLNLDMVYTLKNMLEARGARVVLSRKGDESLSMAERKRIFSEAGIDIMVSIHCNAAGGHPLRVRGSSCYYKSIANRPLAKTLLESLLELDVRNAGLVGNFNFSLTQPGDYPCVLVETLYMSHPEDEELLADPGFRKKLMRQVAKGLERYLKACREL